MRVRPKPLRPMIAIAILFVLGFMIPIHTHDVSTSSAQAFWNQSELFVLVSQNKIAWSQNLWGFIWRVGEGAFGTNWPPTFKRIDCLVYHVTNSGVDEHFVKDLNASGVFVPYHGSIYALLGGQPGGRAVLKWDVERFAEVSMPEASLVDASFVYRDELFKREGWQRADPLFPVRGSADHEVRLTGGRVVLHVVQTTDGESRIEIVGPVDINKTQLLYSFKDEAGFLAAESYTRLIK